MSHCVSTDHNKIIDTVTTPSMVGIPEHFHYLPRTPNIPHFSMTSTQSLCTPKAALNASEDECEVPIPSSGQPNASDAESDFDDDMPIASLYLQPSQTKSRLQKKPKPPFSTTLPQFTPLSLDPLRVAPTGRANCNVLRDSARHTPFGIFSMFFTTRMLEIIADHTNAYAKEKGAGEGRPWVNTSPSEIQCFMGICLYMGLFGCPRVQDYWNTNWHTPSFFLTSYMTLVRFQQIKRYLHICDIHGDNGSSFFFNKIEPLFSHFVTISKQLWVPSSYVSCDEMMVMNFGRRGETVRMKNKPIGSGFKIWALCDSGYIFHAFPSSNKYPWKHCSAYKGILPHCAAVVAQLVDNLPRSSHYGKSRLKKMYAAFMDNLFSTPKLFPILRDKDIAAVGTRSNAKGFPKSLAVRGGDYKKMNWNTLGAEVCEGGKVLAVTWIDNGAVQMLTTLHNVGPGHTLERPRKRPRLTSTNGRRVRAVFGEDSIKKFHIPQVIDDYNFNMGGVDIADQLRSSYTSHRVSFRTWMSLFFWIVDSCVSNSYFILSSLDSKWQNSHRLFRTKLACSLIQCHKRELETGKNTRQNSLEGKKRRRNNETGEDCERKMLKSAEKGGFVTGQKAWNMVSMDANVLHLPIRVDAKERRVCFFCRFMAKGRETAEGARPRGWKASQLSAFRCSGCDLFLCVNKDRNCFIEAHNMSSAQ